MALLNFNFQFEGMNRKKSLTYPSQEEDLTRQPSTGKFSIGSSLAL